MERLRIKGYLMTVPGVLQPTIVISDLLEIRVGLSRLIYENLSCNDT